MAQDRIRELAESEVVTPPNILPVGKETVVLASVGAGLGAAIAGPPGAIVGGTVGWAVDAVRRRIMRP
jgi:hypothetical protein